MHHFKKDNNRHQIKLCSNKGNIFHGVTFPNLTDEGAIAEARIVWANTFIRHKKWLEVIDPQGDLILEFDNL